MDISKEGTVVMVHEMEVCPTHFDHLWLGTKTVETRRWTNDRDRIRAGDHIRFVPSSAAERKAPFQLLVREIVRYGSFREALAAEGVDKCMPGASSLDESVAECARLYNGEKSFKPASGGSILAFRLAPVRPPKDTEANHDHDDDDDDSDDNDKNDKAWTAALATIAEDPPTTTKTTTNDAKLNDETTANKPAPVAPVPVGVGFVQVLDKGFVRLDGVLADDLSVVNAARVSFGKRREVMDASDCGLVGFLMREKHGTPFEHNSFRFHIRCPLFVAREWFRHRIGSFNEFSMRYAKATSDCYLPAIHDVRGQVGKPGAYRFEKLEPAAAAKVIDRLTTHYTQTHALYEELMGAGVAKELARCVLPMGAYTEFYWTVNARSLMNFVSLRNADTALLEIRRFAVAVEQLFATQMPVTYRAFIDNKRRAP